MMRVLLLYIHKIKSSVQQQMNRAKSFWREAHKLSGLLTLGILMSACQSSAPPALENPDWVQLRTQLQSLDDWALRGRVNVRYYDESHTPRIQWQQSGEQYHIRLWGTFNAGNTEIDGGPGLVTLEQDGEVLTASNVYSALHNAYEDLGTFGSALIMIVDDYEDVVRAHSVPIGSFWLATGPRGDVDTMYRNIEMTVKMVVEEFGLDAVCHATRNHFDEGNYHHPVEVIQCVEPNLNRDQHRRDFAGKPWRSIYWEKGAEEGKFLAKRGYDRKPFVAPRWAVTGLEPYGRSPGMDALGDIKMLQLLQREYLKAIEKQVTPPLQAPVSAQNLKISQVPGKINFVSDADLQRGGIRPLYEVHTPLNFLSEKIRETREAVRQVSFADLFMMMAYSDRRQITAEEIIERRSEKMLGLGPVLERLQDELINPLVDLLFDRVLDAGIVPPPPEELQGHELSIVLISMIAREQRGDEMVAVDRVLAAAGGMAGASPGVIDKIDFDQAIDEYARILGAPPRLVRPDDTVQEMRDARNQQQEQMSQMAMMQQGAETAATLGQADAGPGSMLGQLMGAAQGGGGDALASAAAMLGGAEEAPADGAAAAAPTEEQPL